MKVKFLVPLCGILALLSACNNNTESTAKENDTTVAEAKDTAAAVAPAPAPPAETAPVIDSAAVTREFLAAQKKSKKTAAAKPKKQGTNEVVVYNEATIPSHEALEQPAPAKSTSTTPAATRVVHTKEYVYFLPSQNASFPGGPAALNEYMKKNLVYPEEALRHHVEGTVYAEVTIDSLGYVKKVEYPGKQLGSGLEAETTMVLMGTPRWIPAKDQGKPVTSKLTVPVVYKITH
jgi:outer membrane biosynthesis protein TonB